MEIRRKTSLLIATTLLFSMLSVPAVNVFATENAENQIIVESEVDVESPFANVDYSETILIDYAEVLKLTNTTVRMDNREKIEQVIKIIEANQKDEKENESLFENELIYLKSLLLKIDSLEQSVAEEFHQLYSTYLDIKVSDSDCINVSDSDFSVVSEMLEIYYSYDSSIQNKIYEPCSNVLDEYINLFKSYSVERNDYLEKHKEILQKKIEEITLNDRDAIINAVTDFSVMSKANQSILTQEQKLLDDIMSKYLSLEEAEKERINKENIVSDSDKTKNETVVSNSDMASAPISGGNSNTNQIQSDEDIGYYVYDTGDVSFSGIKLAVDTLCLSFFAIILMVLLINQYVDLNSCMNVAQEFSAIACQKYTKFNNNLATFRTVDFDEWSEDVFDKMHNKFEAFRKKHERINRIEIIE